MHNELCLNFERNQYCQRFFSRPFDFQFRINHNITEALKAVEVHFMQMNFITYLPEFILNKINLVLMIRSSTMLLVHCTSLRLTFSIDPVVSVDESSSNKEARGIVFFMRKCR